MRVYSGGRNPRFFGRRFQPFLLGMVLTMIIVAQANFRGMDRGTTYPLSIVLGITAIASAILLIVGWIGQYQRVIEFGLLGVVATYLTRAWFVFLAAGADQAIWFSLAAVMMAGGAYFLEANDRRYAKIKGAR